jgi:hypothetical protein
VGLAEEVLHTSSTFGYAHPGVDQNQVEANAAIAESAMRCHQVRPTANALLVSSTMVATGLGQGQGQGHWVMLTQGREGDEEGRTESKGGHGQVGRREGEGGDRRSGGFLVVQVQSA